MSGQDWSFDTVADAPNFLSFENSGTYNQQRGGQRGRWMNKPWQQRGGYGYGGPQHRGGYGGPPRGNYGGGYQRPYQYGPPGGYRPPRRPYNGWGYQGGRPGRGRFQYRRGGYQGYAHQPVGDVPIEQYFHPSMLEDPWAPPRPRGNYNANEGAQVTVADDDPELLDLIAQQKTSGDASTSGEGDLPLEYTSFENTESEETKQFDENTGGDAEMNENADELQ